MTTIRHPQDHEFAPYYKKYIEKVMNKDFLQALTNAKKETKSFLENLPAKKWDYAYAEKKWTLKEVLIHIIDTERIMVYRALRIARGDKTAMHGFEQDDYIFPAKSMQRSSVSVIDEYLAVRQASIELFKSMDDEMFREVGTASGNPFSPLALGFIIAGHEMHHLEVIKEKYL